MSGPLTPAQTSHPNFPHGLDIGPLVLDNDENGSFNAEAQNRAIQRFGIAGRIWEAAELMIRYFRLSESSDWQLDPPCSIIRRKDGRDVTIMELGSGTGYVGLNLAKQLSRLGKRSDLIILTDLPDVCVLLEETLHHEKHRWMTSHPACTDFLPVKILPLPWGDVTEVDRLSDLLGGERNAMSKPRALTHIICSDLVYFPHLLAPLLRTLLHFTSPPFSGSEHSPEVIISYKIRSLSKETAFWSAFGLWFSFSPVSVRDGTSRTSQERFDCTARESLEAQGWHVFGPEGFLFVGVRRPQSFKWNVPESDSDLLAGIGAQNSDEPQSDDTFETLLMMQMEV
ncbi:hypothetical protein ACEPAH_8237 [Sanghuangporus vaninii]